MTSIGRSVTLVVTVPPQFRHVLQTGEPILEGEVVAETPAHPGESRHYMHSYYPDKSKDGRIVVVSCVVQNLGETTPVSGRPLHDTKWT